MSALVLFVAFAVLNTPAEIVEHNFDVTLNLQEHRIEVVDKISVNRNGKDQLLAFINSEMKISALASGDTVLSFRWADEAETSQLLKKDGYMKFPSPKIARLLIVDLPAGTSEKVDLLVKYSGVLFQEPESSKFNRQDVADQTSGIISEKGVFISPSAYWYLAQPGFLERYSMTINTPSGFEVMSEADIVEHQNKDNRVVTTFKSSHLFDGIHIIAGKYKIETLKHNDVDVMTYFFPEAEDYEKLKNTYLRMSAHYLAMYEKMIGPYPFGKFAVVENFFPTGYGMPSFTLLGSQVIRLPFIPYTSLGHEVLHNWWGNSVYVDYESGNWCEGLTVYGADYLYKEMSSAAEATEYRQNNNRDYTNYVNETNDFPLRKFTSRHDASSRTVGYGKTMMTYHQIRRHIGDELFSKSLQEIYKRLAWSEASWDQILDIFEDVSGKPMEWVDEQYLSRTGAPFISLDRVEVQEEGEGWKVSFELIQGKDLYSLDIPVHLSGDWGETVQVVHLETERQIFELKSANKPSILSIDPDNELFRRLHTEEIPSVLSGVFGGENQLIVLPDSCSEEMFQAYEQMADVINRTKVGVVKRANELTEKEIADSTLLIFGGPEENSLSKIWIEDLPGDSSFGANSVSLLGEEYPGDDQVLVGCLRNPLTPSRSVVIIAGTSPDSLTRPGRMLAHYGKYSYLLFKSGQNVAKGIWQISESPLIKRLGE